MFCRPHSLRLPALSLLLLAYAMLAGCVTSMNLPPGPVADVAAPAVLKSRTATVTGTHSYAAPAFAAGGAAGGTNPPSVNAEIQGWFAAPVADASDYQVQIGNTVQKGKDIWPSFFIYMLSLGVLPAWRTDTITSRLSVSAGGVELYSDTQQTRLRSALTVFSPFAFMAANKSGGAGAVDSTVYLLSAHRAALAQRVEQERVAFEAVAQRGTAADFEGYLASTPHSFFRGEALRGLAALAARARKPKLAHKDYQARYPDYDLARGVIPVSVPVAAPATVPALLPPTESVLATVPAASSLMSGAVASSAIPAAAAPPGVGDIAAQCTKKYAAMKLCDQIPSFGAMVCRSQVNKTYKHVACSLIQ